MDVRKLTWEAERGNATAQYDLSFAYLKGDGVKEDFDKAMYWLKKSANQGHSIAENDLAVIYSKVETEEGQELVICPRFMVQKQC